MFQFHSNSLLIVLLLCHCSNLYNNNYNYNSLSDTTIHNRNSSVRYAAYNLLVTDNFYSLGSNTQLVLTRCCLKHFCKNPSHYSALLQSNTFSLMNIPEMDGSRSWLLEKSFATVCMYMLLSCMPFSYVQCCCLGVVKLVCMCLYAHKILVTLVTCCNNRAAFICVGELVIIVAFAFIYC